MTQHPNSKAAHTGIKPKTPTIRQRIVNKLALTGTNGMTCAELELALGLKHQTCSARVHELRGDGQIVETTSTRDGSSIYVAAGFISQSAHNAAPDRPPRKREIDLTVLTDAELDILIGRAAKERQTRARTARAAEQGVFPWR